MVKSPKQIVDAQAQIIREKLREHKHDYEIIEELKINTQTYYQYKRRIQKQDSKLWDKNIIDSAKARAVELVQLLDYTKNLCLKIADNPTSFDKDRIEAARTACEAQVNILKLINEGPTFRLSLPVQRNAVQ